MWQAQALIFSCLDYCSVLLAGLPKLPGAEVAEGDEHGSKVDRACQQDTVYNSDVVGPALAVDGASDKVQGIGVRAQYDPGMSYVSALVQARVPGCTLHSSTSPPQLEPPKRNKRTKYTSFSTLAPHIWHQLPVILRNSLHAFKRYLIRSSCLWIIITDLYPAFACLSLHSNFMRLMTVIFWILSGHLALFHLILTTLYKTNLMQLFIIIIIVFLL